MLHLRLSQKYLTFVLAIVNAPRAMRHCITSAQNNNLCGKQLIDQPSSAFVKVLYDLDDFFRVLVTTLKLGAANPIHCLEAFVTDLP